MKIHDIFAKHGKQIDDLTKTADQILKEDWNRKGKFPALTIILPRVGAKKMLQLCPNIMHNILSIMG